jgi:hypothetical protein
MHGVEQKAIKHLPILNLSAIFAGGGQASLW